MDFASLANDALIRFYSESSGYSSAETPWWVAAQELLAELEMLAVDEDFAEVRTWTLENLPSDLNAYTENFPTIARALDVDIADFQEEMI